MNECTDVVLKKFNNVKHLGQLILYNALTVWLNINYEFWHKYELHNSEMTVNEKWQKND